MITCSPSTLGSAQNLEEVMTARDNRALTALTFQLQGEAAIPSDQMGAYISMLIASKVALEFTQSHRRHALHMARTHLPDHPAKDAFLAGLNEQLAALNIFCGTGKISYFSLLAMVQARAEEEGSDVFHQDSDDALLRVYDGQGPEFMAMENGIWTDCVDDWGCKDLSQVGTLPNHLGLVMKGLNQTDLALIHRCPRLTKPRLRLQVFT